MCIRDSHDVAPVTRDRRQGVERLVPEALRINAREALDVLGGKGRVRDARPRPERTLEVILRPARVGDGGRMLRPERDQRLAAEVDLSLIHISEPTRLLSTSYAV